MQSYSLSSVPPPSGPKNYVFVDEHNRHKRLKVMRACEGCRRRKIKCDSATTNTWPCAACVRLKLHCVPPAGGLDGEDGLEPGSASQESMDSSYGQSVGAPLTQSQSYPQQTPTFQLNQGDTFHYGAYASNYQKQPYEVLEKSYGNFYPSPQQFPGTLNDPYQSNPQIYQQMQPDSQPVRQERAGSSPSDQFTAEDLMEHLGTLKIGENGVAPYLRQEKNASNETEGPIQEVEMESKISAAFKTGAGSLIRIPPPLMPSQEDALEAFRTFFKDVHPYAPVLCRSQFYNQWQNDRSSISPLVLEAVFANAGRLSDDPAQGAQWLALANKHEACFLDSPRLSTVQALILLLKARESAPKKGYYYRSWMTCKTAVSMAKDLELHEHFETHASGEQCGSDPADCLIKTRVWQTLLICETMVGGPQGRTDLGVDPNSVEFSTTPPCSDIDEFEKSISRQYAYFVRNVRNIRLITDVSHKLKKKKDWGLDQEFVSYNTTFRKWPDELPKDLQVLLPPDGTVPKISSHFLGNMHSHYHLAIVMLRRPQLSAAQTYAPDGAWKQHMSACYKSAKVLCKLQEGILVSFDLTGLLCMQRGINFTIYAILTCIMLHLIALSSPEPEFNSEARDYFIRHMRILERCISAWPMTETEAQINALRAAFSADINKPFELRESFPLGSPSDQSGPSPIPHPSSQPQQNMLDLQQQQQQNANAYMPQHLHLNTMRGQPAPYLATPPISAYSATDSKPHTPIFPSPYEINDPSQYQPMPSNAGSYYHQATSAPGAEIQWNPTPIIQQFDAAFAIQASQLAPPPSLYGGSGSSPPVVAGMTPLNTSFATTNSPPFTSSPQGYPQQQQQQQQHYFATQAQSFHDTSSPVAPGQAQLPSSANAAYVTTGVGAAAMQFVTPRQWQQSVQSVIDPGGLKRRWDYDQHH